MEREEHLRICKSCANRSFDAQKGIICSLTNEIATFEFNCTDYKADAMEISHEASLEHVIANTDEAIAEAKVISRRKKIEARNQRFTKRRRQVDPQKAVKEVKIGANWFYWIACLSIINSLTLLAGSEFGFIMGLGITQFFDGILMEIFGGYTLWSAIPSLVCSAMFGIIGYYANQYSRSAFIIGMVLYGFDTLIFVLVEDYLGIAFHIFVLYSIFSRFKFLKDIKTDDNSIVEEYNNA